MWVIVIWVAAITCCAHDGQLQSVEWRKVDVPFETLEECRAQGRAWATMPRDAREADMNRRFTRPSPPDYFRPERVERWSDCIPVTPAVS